MRQVPVWTARLVSRETHDLCLDAALHMDLLICAVPSKLAHLGVATAARWVHEARLPADLDHIDAYVPPDQGGPPGQTSAGNLAPLCRRHHNAKTHRSWTYHRPNDGSYAWTAPTGHRYDVIPVSRTPLSARRT